MKNILLKKLILYVMAALCWFYAWKSYVSIEANTAADICLNPEYPSESQAEEILEKSAASDTPTDICFYLDGGFVSVRNPALGRNCQAQAAGVTGDVSLYSPLCTALDADDREGCIISRGLALKLFGSDKAVGETVTVGENIYYVRQVTPWNQFVLLFHPAGTDIQYTRVFVRPASGESAKKTAENFLMSYGLSGAFILDDGLGYVGRAFLLLFLLSILTSLAAYARKNSIRILKADGSRNRAGFVKKDINISSPKAGGNWNGAVFARKDIDISDKRADGSQKKEIFAKETKAINAPISAAVRLVCAAVILLLLAKAFPIPADSLPTKWSDFSFWPQQWQQFRENITRYFLLPKTIPECRNLVGLIKTAALGLISFFCGQMAAIL